jgi:ABC-type Na+ transport system ATPase subunit NatA
VRDLRVVRGGVTVLPGLSLSAPKGSVTGLLGPSGCGKSTLMRAIVGTQLVASGEVTSHACWAPPRRRWAVLSRRDLLLLMREGRLVAADTPDAMRHRTGCEDLGEAFLRLVEADAETETEEVVR